MVCNTAFSKVLELLVCLCFCPELCYRVVGASGHSWGGWCLPTSSLERPQGHTHSDCPLLLLGCSRSPPHLITNQASCTCLFPQCTLWWRPLPPLEAGWKEYTPTFNHSNFQVSGRHFWNNDFSSCMEDSQSPGSHGPQPWAGTSPGLVTASPSSFQGSCLQAHQPFSSPSLLQNLLHLLRESHSSALFSNYLLWLCLAVKPWLTSWRITRPGSTRTLVVKSCITGICWITSDKRNGVYITYLEQHFTTVGWDPGVGCEGTQCMITTFKRTE